MSGKNAWAYLLPGVIVFEQAGGGWITNKHLQKSFKAKVGRQQYERRENRGKNTRHFHAS